MVASGLLKPVNREMMLVSDTIEDLLNQMLTYEPPLVGKWMAQETT